MTRANFLLVAALALAGCASPLPSTELPPARFVEPAPEFPGLRDYRGIVDLAIKPSGLDQSAVADLARTAQIDFVVLGDSVKPGDSDFGIGGFTDDILFIPGGTFAVDGGEIVGVNLRAAVAANLNPVDLIAAIHDQGGLAIARDPAKFSSSADYALADAIEVYNQRSTWSAVSATTLQLRA